MKCWSCGGEESDPPFGKLPFRACCEKCSAALHCCVNCIYYKPGLPNDCAVPGTDFIPDRRASNFCEEFKLLGKGPIKTIDPQQIAKKLFGEDPSPPKDPDQKKRFNSLFKEEP